MATSPRYSVLAVTVLLSACGDGQSLSNDGTRGDGHSDRYLRTLPSWEEHTRELDRRPEDEEGVEQVDDAVPPVVSIERVSDPDGDGSITTTVKECTTERVSFFETPDEYVMFSPPTDVLYPGALIQGRSLKEGQGPGDLLPLPIDERSPIDVSIPDCNIGTNFRTVAPNLESVNAAVGDILHRAHLEGVSCASPAGSFVVETYRNDRQRALAAGISGRYFGFSASANASHAASTAENSVAAMFRESLFRVQVEAPPTPGRWFSSELTPEKLQQQIDLGRIGPDNPPAYVAEVVYGRIMKATMTSHHSESRMRAAMEAKYENPVADFEIEGEIGVGQVVQDSRFTFAYYGGSAEATSAALQSENWGDYFTTPATPDDAVPISFVIKSTTDNVPAVIQELTEYDRTTCVDGLTAGGIFAFRDRQHFELDFDAPGQTALTGDVDGDGREDIVWASTGSRGMFAVAYAGEGGTFGPAVAFRNAEVGDPLGEFHVLLADIDDDGREDIVFNTLSPDLGNAITASFHDGAEGFVHSAAQRIGPTNEKWTTFLPRVAQVDGESGDDLLWNNTPNSVEENRTYVALSVATPGLDPTAGALFEMREPFEHSSRDFSGYEYTHVADFNGDGRDDIAWQGMDAGNGEENIVKWAAGTAGGALEERSRRVLGGGFRNYAALAGDANADGRADLVEPRRRGVFAGKAAPKNRFGIYFGRGVRDEDGEFVGSHTFRVVDALDDVAKLAIADLVGVDENAPVEPDFHLADVNGDGSMDLVLNDKGNTGNLTNTVGVGLSVVGGTEFRFVRKAQALEHLDDWPAYETLIADVTGDLRDDILWIGGGPSPNVYVGVARGN